MDRLSLDEQIELLRDDEPAVSDARQAAAENAAVHARSERIRAFDAKVGASIRNVAVPEGLGDRVMTRIGLESAARATRRRRNFIVSGAGAAVAIALICAVAIWRMPDPSFTSDNVAKAAAKQFHSRRQWTGNPDAMPQLPPIGLASGVVMGSAEITFLKKSAFGYNLQAGAEPGALIVVDRDYFPTEFDFSATYVIGGDDAPLEIRFFHRDDWNEVCILVARDLKPFQSKALIF